MKIHHTHRANPSLLPLARALATASLLTLAHASAWPQALPSGGNVVAGRALISTQGTQMTVVNSPGAILNWTSFNIGAGHGVRFEQADASSQVLNRVLGSNPSSIFGQLTSNGRVWLLNPNGVLFGQNARVDVAGLVTSTLRLNDHDWLAGRYAFRADVGDDAMVVNRGELRTSFGGRIALLASAVSNEGLIETPGGQAMLAAGQSIDLVDTGAPHLAVRVNAAAGAANNLGTMTAAGGRIDLHAASVNQQGIVRADAWLMGAGGEVIMRGSQGVQLAAASVTSADGAGGGTITIDAGGGRASVSGALSVNGGSGAGGALHLFGRELGLFSGARLDASGVTGGGEVLIGGGQQGRDSRYVNAEAVFFDRNASIAADATVAGSGGHVILWSNLSTRAYGSLSARGGALGGDGGFIETSGGWLDTRPLKVDVAAPRGRSGTWLLDPYNIFITDSAGSTNIGPPSFTASGNSALLDSSDIQGALNLGTNVIVSTGGASGSQAGDITFGNAYISVTAPTPGALTLIADGAINGSEFSITSSGGPMAVTLRAGALTGVGNIDLTSGVINSGGGNITLGGYGSAPGPLNGTTISNAAVGSSAGMHGVALSSVSLLAGGGDIVINGIGEPSNGSAAGVVLGNVALQGRDITVRGYVSDGYGVNLADIGVAASRRIAVLGTGGTAGVYVLPNTALVATAQSAANGAGVEITGRALGSDSVVGTGVYIDTNSVSQTQAFITTTGGAPVLIRGANTGGIIDPAVYINARASQPTVDTSAGAGSISISTFDSGAFVTVDTLRIPGTGAFTISGNQRLIVHDSQVSATGPIRLWADDVVVDGTSGLTSGLAGDAIIVSGSANSPLSAFSAAGGLSMALLASNPAGRWIVWGTDVTNVGAFDPGLLPYNFKRYGGGFQSWANDVGNGLVFETPQFATVTGTVLGKVYDGNVAANASGIFASGVLSDSGGLRPGVVLTYADKNAGVNKAMSFSGPDPMLMVDSNGRRVYGYDFDFGSLGATITQRSASVTGLIAANKVYDGLTTATLAGQPSFSILPGDVVSLAASVSATFANKNVGTNKTVNVTGLALDGPDGGNYLLQPFAGSITANITPVRAVLTGLSAANKVYDGNTVATLSGSPGVLAFIGDEVNASGNVTGSFVDKNVGLAKPVTVAGLALSGLDAGNYTLVGATGIKADITPRPIAVSGLVAGNKVYDGTTLATLSGRLSFTTLPGDLVSLSGSATGRFADKNVGLAKPVTLSGLELGGADGANYTLQPVSGLSANITPLAAMISGLAANNKVYDANTIATFSGSAIVSTVSGDGVSLAGTPTGAFADKAVGTAKPVAVTGVTLVGADSGNYTLQPLTGLKADITPRELSVAGLTAASKVYDATTTAALNGSVRITPLEGDVVGTSGTATGVFADKNVGSNKAVSLSGVSLSGVDAGNYRLVSATPLRADITARPLTSSGLVVVNKVYDATTRATLGGTATLGLLPGDAVSLGGISSASFADKNIGTNKPVTLTGLALTGADAGNYSFVPPSSLAGDITPRDLTVAGVAANHKVYDGGAVATLSGTAGIAPLVGDAVGLSGNAVAAFANKNVGNAKAVTLTGLSLQGADAGNYRLLAPPGLSANITPLTLPLSGLSASFKTYDGSVTATLTGSATVTPLAGDAATLAGSASGSFSDRNAGSAKLVLVTGVALSGADAGNYALTLPALRADITPASLSYVAQPLLLSINQPIGALSGTVVGLVGGDTLASATTGTLVFATPAGTGSPAGVYAINGGGLSASNYRLQQAPGNAVALSIVGLSPTVTANAGINLGLSAALVQAQTWTFTTQPIADSGVAGVLDLSDGSTSGAFSTSAASRLVTSGAVLSANFGAVRLADMSAQGIQQMLDARDRYKEALFADAVRQLEQNPALADLQACTSLKEALAGTCMVTEGQLRESRPGVVIAATPSTPTSATAQATPPAPPATPAAVPSAPNVVTPPAPVVASVAPASPPSWGLERRRVLSASLPQIERKVAIIVGVDRYADSSIPALDNAVRDAEAIGALFDTELGYETVVLKNAKRADLVAALNRLALELRPTDSVVIYYAGHGQLVESTKLGYWQLADAQATAPQTWLSNADISRLVGRITASQVAVISDSCYSGSLVSEEKLRASGVPLDPVAVLTRKSVVIMSSGGNEPVFDNGKDGHSPFAWNLMNTLHQVSSWKPGGQVFERVRFAVARELPQRPQYGVSAAAGHQAGGDYLFEQRELENRR